MSSGRVALLLAIITVVALASMVPGRTPIRHIWADEGTYLAMAYSLAQDFDLRFETEDRDRLLAGRATRGDGSATVILQQDEGGASYSKPILFPLAAAPFVALFGDLGPIALNALLLAAALALAYGYLRTRAPAGRAALVLVTFVGAGVVLPYVFWRMSDILQLALVLGGLALGLAGTRRPAEDAEDESSRLRAPAAGVAGAMLLGLSVLMRPSNAGVAAIPVLTAVLQRRGRRAGVLLAAMVAPWLLGLIVTAGLTGSINPYRAMRSSFTPATGYPVDDAAPAQGQFETDPATHRTGLQPTAGIDRSLFAALYFWIGRHSGLLLYFPAAIALGIAALRRPDAPGVASLLGFLVSTVFFVVWMPWNYFGGHTFIGNRYVLTAYPALLVAPRRLPGARLLGIAWLVAGAAYLSAGASIAITHEVDSTSQSHAHAGLFRHAPFESTTVDLAPHQLYWDDLFVRFVDPFADVRPWHFELEAGRPTAEVHLAEWQDPERLRLLVTTDAPEATLIAHDYRGRWRYDVGARQRRGRYSDVDLTPSPAWRRHRFWWHPTQMYNISALRLQLTTPDGSPARAQLRLIGDPDRLRETFAYERLSTDIPTHVDPSRRTVVRAVVRNTSPRVWRHEGVAPVYGKIRLTPRRGPDAGATWESDALWLPRSVQPGETAEITYAMDWPARPGAYDLEIDLVLARVAWFAARTGAPVARQKVRVVEPDAG